MAAAQVAVAAEVPRTAAPGQTEPVTAVPAMHDRRVRPPEVLASAKRWAAVYVPEGRSAAAAVVPLVPATPVVGCK
jgi:hypothetical protein